MVALCYLGFLGLSFLGAVCDILFYRIPNFAIGLIFLGSFVKLGLQYSTLDLHLTGMIFITTLLAGYLLYVLKLMGAGDAKFLSASILWIEPSHVPSYLVLVALSGGVLALIFIVGHDQIDYARLKIIDFLKKKYSTPETTQGFKGYPHLPFENVRRTTWLKTLVPYGVAIFAGNLMSTYHIYKTGL
ncbi:MAG: A24 family peptidase [Janthinobacterium lividum]